MLADPFNAALDGPHSRFREVSGRIQRYRADVSVFYGHPRELTAEDYIHVARLAGDTGIAVLRDRATALPAGWSVVETFGLVQYEGSEIEAAPDPAAIPLTPADVPEMTALVERTKPGPFLPGPSNSEPIWVSAPPMVRSSRWPASGCDRPDSRKSAQCAPPPKPADRAWRPA